MKVIIIEDCTAEEAIQVLQSLESKPKFKVQGITDGEPIDPETGLAKPHPGSKPPGA